MAPGIGPTRLRSGLGFADPHDQQMGLMTHPTLGSRELSWTRWCGMEGIVRSLPWLRPEARWKGLRFKERTGGRDTGPEVTGLKPAFAGTPRERGW